jgi:prolyl oligopeptidase
MHQASDVLRIYDIQESNYHMAIELHEVELPEKGSINAIAGDVDENMFLFKLETYTIPGDFYRLDLNTYELEHFFKNKDYKKVAGWNVKNYAVDHITYKSKDGTRVPMTLVGKKKVLKSLKDKPKKPIVTHLYGYGGFGDTCKPTHDYVNQIFLNNMDGLYVVAHIRGGGEYGDDWWENGKKEKKQNSFDDFIAAAEYLI